MISKAGKLFVGACFAVGAYYLITETGPWLLAMLDRISEVANNIRRSF